VRVEITAKPIAHFDTRDPTRVRFGALEFRGGLELTSSNKDFGGLSALRVSPDGGFIALTDRARWLRGRIVSEAGRPVRITDAEMAPILGPDGRPLVQRGWYDTEALADDGGTLYVGIEGVNQILRFDFGKDGLSARGRPIPGPSAFASLPHNRGIEGLVFVPRGLPLGGTLMAFSERALDPKGNIKAFLIGGPSPGQSISQSTSQLTVRRSDDFDITDAAVTPSGDLFLLERRFAWTRGLAIRIRRLSLGTLNPNAPVDGPVVLDADLGQQIDNFEGLSAHRTAGGDTVLTLIADDNFSILQRTLLMQFTVVGE
jgi:hypothetical protein